MINIFLMLGNFASKCTDSNACPPLQIQGLERLLETVTNMPYVGREGDGLGPSKGAMPCSLRSRGMSLPCLVIVRSRQEIFSNIPQHQRANVHLAQGRGV